MATVLRKGRLHVIPASQLVPGDIVEVAGQLQVSQLALTAYVAFACLLVSQASPHINPGTAVHRASLVKLCRHLNPATAGHRATTVKLCRHLGRLVCGRHSSPQSEYLSSQTCMESIAPVLSSLA